MIQILWLLSMYPLKKWGYFYKVKEFIFYSVGNKESVIGF